MDPLLIPGSDDEDEAVCSPQQEKIKPLQQQPLVVQVPQNAREAASNSLFTWLGEDDLSEAGSSHMNENNSDSEEVGDVIVMSSFLTPRILDEYFVKNTSPTASTVNVPEKAQSGQLVKEKKIKTSPIQLSSTDFEKVNGKESASTPGSKAAKPFVSLPNLQKEVRKGFLTPKPHTPPKEPSPKKSLECSHSSVHSSPKLKPAKSAQNLKEGIKSRGRSTASTAPATTLKSKSKNSIFHRMSSAKTSPPEKLGMKSCPICEKNLKGFSLREAQMHVNQCIERHHQHLTPRKDEDLQQSSKPENPKIPTGVAVEKPSLAQSSSVRKSDTHIQIGSTKKKLPSKSSEEVLAVKSINAPVCVVCQTPFDFEVPPSLTCEACLSACMGMDCGFDDDF